MTRPHQQPLNPNVELARMAAVSRHPMAEQYRNLAELLALTAGMTAKEAIMLLDVVAASDPRLVRPPGTIIH